MVMIAGSLVVILVVIIIVAVISCKKKGTERKEEAENKMQHFKIDESDMTGNNTAIN